MQKASTSAVSVLDRRPRAARPLAVVLAAGMFFAALAPSARVTAETVAPLTLAAMAEADARRSRALMRIDTAIRTLSGAEREALELRFAAQIDAALLPMRSAVDAAKREIDASVGFLDAFSAEQRDLKFREALARAGLAAAAETLARSLQGRIGQEIGALYEQNLARLNQILREEFADPLGPRAGALVLADLAERLARAPRSEVAGLPAADPGMGGEVSAVPLFAGGAALALRRVMVGRIGGQMLQRLGGGLAGPALGRAAAIFALSPGKATGVGIALDAGIAALSIGAFVLEGGRATRTALQDELESWFIHQVVAPLRDPATLRVIADAAIAGVEAQLRRDRDAAAMLVARRYAGVFEQMRSPGFADFAARSGDAALRQTLFAVPAVFGADFVDVDYDVKVELALRILPTDSARQLVQRHGRRFLDLFRAHPEDAADVANRTDAPRAFAHILAAGSPQDELLLLRRALDRLGAMDGAQTAALVLARRLAPAAPVELVHADALVRLAAIAGPLEAAAATRPAETSRLVVQVLDGSLSQAVLTRVLGRAETPALLELLDAAGPQRFEALLGVASREEILRYLQSVPDAQRILLADGPGSLRFHQLPAGGGVRAVLARERVRQQVGGSLDASAEEALRWLLARTDLAAAEIDFGLLRNLQALHIPGPLWIDGLAVPVAGVIARTGLRFPLLLLILLAAAPAIAWWLRLFPRRGLRIGAVTRSAIAEAARRKSLPRAF
ncbi:hypothetical protein GXW71_05625 [Roseomonas hellenica]|uniref:Uncharacterized protein n=1 Tax=Plastoroseomonas hellenica TaxID=2687306 RepID=A0ABS5EU80_9PROT|nr:hypothetical protein [Plastoroseomonas hellenica]MBR0663834.1 hypothetical protein [Plastoroseomonas hellenica]